MLIKPDYFINRELSWLKFNCRVLEEAAEENNPLLERLRFIAITGSNLDEFFMIRVAGLQQRLESGINKKDAAGLTVAQQLEKINESTRKLVQKQYRYLRNLEEQMERYGIQFASMSRLTGQQREWTEQYYRTTIFPVITPLAVDSSHPFPFLANRTLNLAVEIKHGKNEQKIAVIQVPAVLPRLVKLPDHGNKKTFIFLEEIIQTYCDDLFLGYSIKTIVPFRITRNADLTIDEEEAEDLLAEVEKSLRQRKRGEAVRLEIGKTTNKGLRKFIIDGVKIKEKSVYDIQGPIDTSCFMKFGEAVGAEQLLYTAFIPAVPAGLVGKEDLFAAISAKDILLHHPYESFTPVIDFIRQAAVDPEVLAIKQTLYRVGGDSPIVRALAEAAENGKQVTVLVELKARFDEETNIQWAKRLEDAGCHVIYGLVGLKTHAKIALVVRREYGAIKRYVHMATGNYNESTARQYTDIGLLTANDQIGADASAFFNVLSGYSDPPVWNKLGVAPIGLRQKFYDLLERESAFAKEGKPARVIAKINSLVDTPLIVKLYEASCDGVKIDLIVRGICTLRPGLRGVSENITVRSIVGRFLEHSRVFYFANGGDEQIYLSSADWMTRNLNDRVELLFPVNDSEHKARTKGILELLLQDTEKAHVMRSDAVYCRADRRRKKVHSQKELLAEAVQLGKAARAPLTLLKPAHRREESDT
ncbi:MAG: ppk [Firmicutes bacterium]|nr:ppk [Bacillota bacterium]